MKAYIGWNFSQNLISGVVGICPSWKNFEKLISRSEGRLLGTKEYPIASRGIIRPLSGFIIPLNATGLFLYPMKTTTKAKLKAYFATCQTSVMELFAKLVNGCNYFWEGAPSQMLDRMLCLLNWWETISDPIFIPNESEKISWMFTH